MQFMRMFNEFDIEEVNKHLLITGDLSSDCANCRALGINGYEAVNCPECGTPFKYVTSRRLEQHSGERFQIVKRMKQKRPELIFIDYTDYSNLMGKKKARDFFG